MVNPNKEKAQLDLNNIEDLRACPQFEGYYLRRLLEKIKAREARVLDLTTSPEDTAIEKKIIAALREDALNLTARDEASCRSVLAGKD